MYTRSSRPLLAALSALLLASCGGDQAQSLGSATAVRAGATMSGSSQQQAPATRYTPVVQQLYIAYFGRPADVGGLANFQASLAAIGAPTGIQQLVDAYGKDARVRAEIDKFGFSDESKRLYGTDTTTFLNGVYQNVLGRAPDTDGLNYWRGKIDRDGLSKGNAALAIMAGALANTTPQGLADASTVNKKVQAGTDFTSALVTQKLESSYDGDAAAAKARAVLTAITSTTDSQAIAQSIQATLTAWASVARLSKMVTSGLHTLAIDSQSRLWAWGVNGHAEWGNGSYGQVSRVPYLVGTGYVDACAGTYVSGGIKSDGTLWMWGQRTSGVLGHPPVTIQSQFDWYSVEPTLVGTGYAKCSTNGYTTLALKTDGSVWGWGEDGYHNLGISNDVPYSGDPVRLETGYADVSVGYGGAAGVKTDGSLWIWGRFSNGSKVLYDSRTPRQLGTGFQSVSASGCSVLALKRDGTLWKWGCDVWDTATISAELTQVGSGFKEIAPVSNILAGVKQDGTLWVWGNVGRKWNTTINSYVHVVSRQPTLVGSGFAHATAGGNTVMATRTDGSIVAIGDNPYMNTGLDNRTNYDKFLQPVNVGTLQDLIDGTPNGTPLSTKDLTPVDPLPLPGEGTNPDPGTGTPPGGGTGTLTWSDWFFIQSDKPVQQRWAVEKMVGTTAYVRVQYRVLKTDATHCTASVCDGYYLYYSYHMAGNDSSTGNEKFYYWFTKAFNGPVDAGVQLIDFRVWPDGSQLKWTAKDGIRLYMNGQITNIPWDDRCVDDKRTDSSSTRCYWVDFSKAVTVSRP
ncbi:DUF4214 domain-containing protein [Massilia arenosa]|uniref:DUF4214 domain-containing protein n=1 Tax=Zemynaea arenosa TaxID=2561931 RepID=A0A4Y9SK43_9BURK|nr:DUF4214 domain-containing protein [Massilia arenosa]TFW22913.1 DUF4214 domain-containing protein [Massilia arenosa]